MPAQMLDQKPEFAPLWDIPDAWGKACCPVCGEAKLSVVHFPDYPDHFKCSNCEIAFDVERGGKLIRLKYIPEELTSLDESLRFTWVNPPSVRREVRKRGAPPVSALQPESQSLTDEDVLKRAAGMYRLGNAPEAILTSLRKAGASDAQIQGIVVRVQRQASIDSRKQSKKFLYIVGAAVLLIVSLGAWLVLGGILSPSSASRNVPTPASFIERLPPAIRDRLPTTSVNRGGSQISHGCPTTSKQAAALFGGEAGSWTEAQPGAWQMMNVQSSISAFVPARMTAGFIKNQSMQFSTVNGPAIIYGVNFITIMCE